MRETDVAGPVASHFHELGATVYHEVDTAIGRADLVAVVGAVVWVVECKAALSLRLLDQAVRWRGQAHRVVVATPAGRRSAAAAKWFRVMGVGWWWVGGAYNVREVEFPRLTRRIGPDLTRWLHPAQASGQYAAGGSARGGHYSAFKQTCGNLRRVVHGRPEGVDLREALQSAGHHYASMASALASLPGLIEAGRVPGVRLEKRGRRSVVLPASGAA